MSSQDYLEGNLRPYVVRSDFDVHYPISFQPDIGIVDNSTGQSISQSLPYVQSQRGVLVSNVSSRKGLGLGGYTPNAAPSNEFEKSVYDLEWKDLFDWNNLKELGINLAVRFLQGWFKCVLNQPFDNVKMLLQVGSFKLAKSHQKPRIKQTGLGAVDTSDSSDDEANDSNYFVEESPSRLRESRIEIPGSRRHSTVSRKNEPGHDHREMSVLIQPSSLNMFDMANALLSKEGPRGILKSVNTTFLMKTLHYTIEAWVSGFISGMLGIPDPLFVEMIHSPNINFSLLLSVISNTIASLLLTQISLIRTRFIITTSSRGCRSFRDIASSIPKSHIFTIPKDLLLPALFTGVINSFTFHYPDYLLTSMKINKYNNAYLYNSFSLLLRMAGVLIRLPFETLYTRAQVNYLLTNTSELPPVMRVKMDDLCVEFGGYYGYLSTLYYVFVGVRPMNYEGASLEVDLEDESNKGIQAIFRGWKVALIRLVSSFTLNLLREEQYSIEKF